MKQNPGRFEDPSGVFFLQSAHVHDKTDNPLPLGMLLNMHRQWTVLNPRETQVHFYGDVAILTEHVTVDGEDRGRHFGGEFRFVRIFTKQNGNWKVVLAQGAPLPTQSPDAK